MLTDSIYVYKFPIHFVYNVKTNANKCSEIVLKISLVVFQIKPLQFLPNNQIS